MEEAQAEGPSTPTAERPLRGAAAAQAGYDYQLDVSILAALRLLLISKAATRITLEPANEEDLEADLAPRVPGRIEPHAMIAGGYKLVVQVKMRTGEPWSIEDLRDLLEHGAGEHKAGRTKALHHLDDPNTRYLLVTNAAAKGVARDLLVEGFEETADKDRFPKTLKTTLKKKPEGRVAIWEGLTEKQLASDTDELLNLLHVPETHRPNLIERLRVEARRRTRASTPGIWTREDLLATIRLSGGFLASEASLESFVPPANFDAMVERLNARGAVVLRGPSGTGKTQAALKLCELARKRNGALEVVTVGADHTPSSTRKLVDTGPTLFYVDDPWGQYSLLGGSEAWTEELPKLLAKANPDHQFVITSRSDMMQSAKVGDSLNLWSIELDAEHYREGRLAAIHDHRMDALPPDLQTKAYGFRREALDAFETPLQIDLYFTNMLAGPLEGEQDYAFFRRLLKLAQRGAVRDVVDKSLTAIDRHGFSAVIWALLAARSQLDRGQLTALQRVLRGIDRDLGDGLEKAVDRLVAMRHLRQPARLVSFSHPSVREGFEAFLLNDWSRTEGACADLVAALVTLQGGYRAWGLETAARVVEVARNLSTRVPDLDPPFEASPASREAIDAWLDESLLDPSSDFLPLLDLASDVGTEASVPSKVARWLLKGIQRGGSVFLENWSPPVFDEDWYEAVSVDPRSALVAGRFIREGLPWDRGNYGPRFAEKLDRIATGLTPAFADAALTMVGSGFEVNADAVAKGAIRDVEGFEPVLTAALDDLANDRRRAEQEGAEQWRAIEDGERDYGAEEGFQSQHEGDGYTSGAFVDAYVERLRADGHWHAIAEHPRVTEFAARWARAIAISRTPTDLNELYAVLEATRGTDAEQEAWWALRENWVPELEAALAARLGAVPADPRVREEIAVCALTRAPKMLGEAIGARANDPAGQLIWIAAMHATRSRLGSSRTKKIARVTKALSPDLAAIAAALATKRHKARPVGAATVALMLKAATTLPPEVLHHIVPVILASGSDAKPAIRRWLQLARDKDLAIGAAEAAALTGDHVLLELALRHDRADARRVAMLRLVEDMADPLPREILALASDAGSRVRRALVAILSKRPHPDHLPVLLGLARDTWSNAEPYYDMEENYKIAQEAVFGLAHYGPLDDATFGELLDLAGRTPDRTLSQYLLILAAGSGSAAIRERIWRLVHLPEPKLIRIDAMDALADAEFVEPAILDENTTDFLLRAPAVIAAPAAHLLARLAPLADVVAAFERIASSNRRRALLLVGAAALANRDRPTAVRILDLLEPGHPARQFLDATEPLPASILDDLGKVRLRKAVRARLGERIAPDEPRNDASPVVDED